MILPQINRIVLLFIFFISVFLIVRSILLPDTFGQYGHYRGDSLGENASKEKTYADVEDCKACHDDVAENIQNDMHAGLSCLICHGPGNLHVEDPQAGNIAKESGREFCGKCHGIHPARSTDVIFQVDIHTHHIEKADCIECHNPHTLWEGME